MLRPVISRVTRPLAVPAWRCQVFSRSYASAPKSSFDWEDPLASKNLLTEEELAISETAERYCQERLLPRVLRELFQ